MSSALAPNSIASAASAIRSEARGPTMCTPSDAVGARVGEDLHRALRLAHAARAAVGQEREGADRDREARSFASSSESPTLASSGQV